MKKILGSIRLWFVKVSLRRKYASKLKRNYDLSTVEGRIYRGKVNQSNILINRGIEPTEENLAIFQEEVNAFMRELEKKYPPELKYIEPARQYGFTADNEKIR